MRILLDECVPAPLRDILTGHDCSTSKELGWDSIKNGELLRRAEAQFDLFITADQNIRYQQNLSGRTIRIIELSTNKLRRLIAAKDLIQSALSGIKPGEFVQIPIPE
jgi:predicted nuclease of predicted toxin-antitoxin system